MIAALPQLQCHQARARTQLLALGLALLSFGAITVGWGFALTEPLASPAQSCWAAPFVSCEFRADSSPRVSATVPLKAPDSVPLTNAASVPRDIAQTQDRVDPFGQEDFAMVLPTGAARAEHDATRDSWRAGTQTALWVNAPRWIGSTSPPAAMWTDATRWVGSASPPAANLPLFAQNGITLWDRIRVSADRDRRAYLLGTGIQVHAPAVAATPEPEFAPACCRRKGSPAAQESAMANHGH